MKTTLTATQESLHGRAVHAAEEFHKCTWSLIEILHEAEHTKLHRAFDCASLFVYAVNHLKLDESVAYTLITAARKAREIPRLARSLREQKLSLAKAARIFSTLSSENADQLVSFAENHSTREINLEVARVRKKAGLPQMVRTIQISEDTLNKIKRVRSLSRSEDLNMALDMALDEYLERHDPIKKAARANQRVKRAEPAGAGQQAAHVQNAHGGRRTGRDQFAEAPISQVTPPAGQLCTYRVQRRKPLTAAEKHQVVARDGGRCTHQDGRGIRCANDRYLHIHHIKPVSLGGTNDPNNLTTLCSFHHDLAHQLSLPLEGQVTWLREPRWRYL
jgi:5-methylcytosine-specific restriction endonuclease McrA